jgi:hypothetical protein
MRIYPRAKKPLFRVRYCRLGITYEFIHKAVHKRFSRGKTGCGQAR